MRAKVNQTEINGSRVKFKRNTIEVKKKFLHKKEINQKSKQLYGGEVKFTRKSTEVNKTLDSFEN